MNMRIMSAVTILLLMLTGFSTADEAQKPLRAGAFIGDIPVDIDFSKRNGFPSNYGAWAGHLYLSKNNIQVQDWINKAKSDMVSQALRDAKAYAIRKGFKWYAVDNLAYQVVNSENRVQVYVDCNIIGWSE